MPLQGAEALMLFWDKAECLLLRSAGFEVQVAGLIKLGAGFVGVIEKWLDWCLNWC